MGKKSKATMRIHHKPVDAMEVDWAGGTLPIKNPVTGETVLTSCAYIRDNHHVIMKGATGAGISYIAHALGVAACRQLYKVCYIRIPALLNEYALAKSRIHKTRLKKLYQV